MKPSFLWLSGLCLVFLVSCGRHGDDPPPKGGADNKQARDDDDRGGKSDEKRKDESVRPDPASQPKAELPIALEIEVRGDKLSLGAMLVRNTSPLVSDSGPAIKIGKTTAEATVRTVSDKAVEILLTLSSDTQVMISLRGIKDASVTEKGKDTQLTDPLAPGKHHLVISGGRN
jgi:hypothetical protein